ncbi:hypothetical protein KCU81_g7053, partial [Aureobasidium melanogenum]|uniref:Thioredoxin-like fold domain-containing protein n=1 Tax=Aureobasidium melanogenum (strain CBS 110374) TaxID=1043003 RepID=A0A074VU72_AURM1
MSSTSITVFRGFEASGYYTWSPFVTKLEARLRFAKVPYTVDSGSPMKAPRGKIPYVQLVAPDQPVQLIGDSELIIKQLVDEGVLEDCNAKMSRLDQVHDYSVRALLEDKLYFYQVYEKWIENYYAMRPVVLAALPYPVQLVVGLLIYRSNKQTLQGQGTLRFTSREIADFRQQIWQHISTLLTAARTNAKVSDDAVFWLFGKQEPSEADAVLYGFIVGALVCSAAPDSQAIVRSFPMIVEYATRIHEEFFPDYAIWER